MVQGVILFQGLVGTGTRAFVSNDFHRIKRLPPYVFEQVNKLKAEARARGDDIIDFGMGNPDMPTPEHIVAKLVETVREQTTSIRSAGGIGSAYAYWPTRVLAVRANKTQLAQIAARLGQ